MSEDYIQLAKLYLSAQELIELGCGKEYDKGVAAIKELPSEADIINGILITSQTREAELLATIAELRASLAAITHTGDKVSMVKTAKQALEKTKDIK